MNSDGEQYGVGTYPLEWAQHYIAQGYSEDRPGHPGLFPALPPPSNGERLDWWERPRARFSSRRWNMVSETRAIRCPLRGPNGQFALFTVNDSCSDEEWRVFCEANVRDLLMIAHYFNRRRWSSRSRGREGAEAPEPKGGGRADFPRSRLQRAQIAEMLEISEHTLRVYVESARFKLGAMNTTQAVARALSLGLIVV